MHVRQFILEFRAIAQRATATACVAPPCRYTYDLGMVDKRGNVYKELNVDLRRFAQAGPEEHTNLKGSWGALVLNVIRAMGKMPVKTKVTLYRGRPDGFCELRSIYHPGRVCWWAAFTSCTPDPTAAAHMSGPYGCVLELQCDQVHDISEMSFFPDEKEMLLPPNTQWVPLKEVKQHPVPETEGYPAHCVHVISLLQILPGTEIVS
jgi:hypothetical protein